MSDTESSATSGTTVNMEDTPEMEVAEIEVDDNDEDEMVLSEQGSDEEDEQDDEEEDEEDEPEVVMVSEEKKLPEIEKQDMVMYHPKLKQHNYEEILARVTVQRDSKGNIQDEYHKTIPILTRYEQARILGARAKQLNH